MVRIIIKGGVWRNTEDEILKAAISKYGKNVSLWFSKARVHPNGPPAMGTYLVPPREENAEAM